MKGGRVSDFISSHGLFFVKQKSPLQGLCLVLAQVPNVDEATEAYTSRRLGKPLLAWFLT